MSATREPYGTIAQAVSCIDGYDPDALRVDRADAAIRACLAPISGTERVPVREGAPIFDAHNRRLGAVTSGTLAPTVNQPIAMAYLAANHGLPHHEVYAEVRGKRYPMRVSAMPFSPHRYYRG